MRIGRLRFSQRKSPGADPAWIFQDRPRRCRVGPVCQRGLDLPSGLLNQRTTEKNTGVRKMPNRVTPNMPAKTAVPSERRISAPAPAAKYGGTMWMKHERRHDDRPQPHPGGLHGGVEPGRAFLLAVAGELDDQDGVLAGQADQHHEADLHEDVDVHAADRDAGQAHSRHIGTTRITASGSDQLSYRPASTKKTSTAPSTNALNGFCRRSRNCSTLLDCFCK